MRLLNLETATGRYSARRAGLDVPLRHAKPRPFWDHVEKTETCWLWRGPVNKVHGYGVFHAHGAYHRAHRYAWMLTFGPIPDGLVVCHRCDVKLCVRLSHLFVGTQNDNIQDKVSKHRQARGETIGSAKLTRAQADEIRSIATLGQYTAIGKRFGVDRSIVARIVAGKAWK